MIIYLLLEAILFILDIIAGIFGGLIPGYPSVIIEIFDTISSMVNGGMSFIGYFFNIGVITALITLVISWHGFKVVKDALMKVN